MENTAKVIQFPTRQSTRRTNQHSVPASQIRNVDGIKYFTSQQIKLLRRIVRDQAQLAVTKGTVTAVKEWMVIDLLTSTGLRVSEAANLRCDDIRTGYGESAIFVRDGKNHKSRTVQINESLKKHLKSFIRWKRNKSENTADDDFIFISKRGGGWSRQAVQQLVKKYLKQLGLYESGKSVHALRHSYATELYRNCRDLRAVQKQLGHSSIQTTQIYADVTTEDLQSHVRGMWSGV